MLLLLTAGGLVEALPQGSQSCSSPLAGDTTYTLCGAFCKAEKASALCGYCKCKRCTFCGGTLTPPAEPRQPSPKAAAAPAATAVSVAPSLKKKKSSAAPTPAPAPAPSPQLAPSPSKKKKFHFAVASSPPPPPPPPLAGVKCSSKQFGDTSFESCAPFCKKEKSASHCKFCKCKQCDYCKHVEL
ncbi:hypothetical protein AB1Y20_023389 [Prymnesium parvum]|uniref:Uncharacterized protein n=1 Tax=Prymnesium parvum TaxID=97485 RepID=A0AB34JD40_PRYPA